MIKLIGQIRQNLRAFAYPNEASISHGIVMPVLQALGWNTADPSQLVPEYTLERQRVDFALLGAGRKPTVFIEVKGQGLAAQGDRQLFGYAFHAGVPLCVLTDGAEWSFYLPGAQGSYEDRRVYRLQVDERSPEECEHVLKRYLQRDRVSHGQAYEDAQRDYRDAASRREAVTALPTAWSLLVEEPDGTLMSLLSDKVESVSGFRPTHEDILEFFARLGKDRPTPPTQSQSTTQLKSARVGSLAAPSAAETTVTSPKRICATLLGEAYEFENASTALAQILGLITKRDYELIPQLAAAVRGRERSHIARTAREIHPERPDLARAAEFAPGWVVGLNLSNRQKMRILKAACVIYYLPEGALNIDLPNV